MSIPLIQRASGGRVGVAGALVLGIWLLAGVSPAQDDGDEADGNRAANAAATASDEKEDGRDEKAKTKRIGKLIRVPLPIRDGATERLRQFVRRAQEKAKEADAKLTLIFEFVVPEKQEEFGRGSDLPAAFGVADLISEPKMAGVQTVAYVPQPIQGHAVLPVLACDEIIMAPEASFGKAGIDETIVDKSQRGIYQEIADRRKTVPASVALWLLDPSNEVYVVDTDLSREYVDEAGLAELEKRRPIKSKQKLYNASNAEESIASERGELTGAEARPLNFVSYLASRRQDVAKTLGLSPESMDEDFSLVADWRPFRIEINGAIDHQLVSQVQRLVSDAIETKDANFICLLINSLGGSPADSVVLAGFLSDLDPSIVRTVAFVQTEARSDAALVALACQQLVMAPKAELGGAGNYTLAPNDIEYATESIRDPDGPWKEYPWSLPAAMIDPNLTVYHCTRLDEVAYFCDEEFDERNDALNRAGARPLWSKGRQITKPGEAFRVDGQQAVEFGLADATISSPGKFADHYDLKDFPTLLEVGWADRLIQGLASPTVAALLLSIAFIAMYAELHAPGIGIGGFVATICVLMFFWAHFLGGTANWLEIMLFLAGVCFILLEVFVLPGLGIFGFGGAGLIVVSLILATQTFVLPRNSYQVGQLHQSLVMLGIAGLVVVVGALMLRRYLPESVLFRQLFLAPPAGEEAAQIERRESLLQLEGFVGRTGTATTQLTPSGKARFGEELLDVITDGEVVERGAKVEVVETHGTG